MANLILKKPTGKKWPDFFGEKTKERSRIENNSAVKSLVSSGFLLTKFLNNLLYSFLINTNSIKKEIESEVLLAKEDTKKIIAVSSKMMLKKKSEVPGKKLTEAMKNKIIDKTIDIFLIKKREQPIRKITKLSSNIEDMLADFEDMTGKKLKAILSTINIYYCIECNKLHCLESVRKGSCKCGKKINSFSDLKKITPVVLPEEVVKFVSQNMWLEYGVESLFRKANFNTNCGVYVMGSSGIRHEIDVIAENHTTLKRVITECKTQPITRVEIFKLYVKMLDLGCSRGLIFSTSPDLINKDVIKFASYANIFLVNAVLELKEEALMGIIKSI